MMAAAMLSGAVSADSSSSSSAVLTQHNIPLNLAVEIASGAVAACAANKYSVSAAVVDRGGVLRALLRADEAGIHTADAARQKAYTSASSRQATSAMVKSIQQNPDAAQLVAIDGFLVLAGGVPIKLSSTNETIGAIGVGGAPGGHLDEACALAALAQVQAKLQH
ncbi:hypothetical protein DV735_g4342, partial [Chaetothyriales sp. CBS 134920]